VLMSMPGGVASAAQGIEVPLENSSTRMSHCGQGNTLPFHLQYHEDVVPPSPVPKGESYNISYAMQGLDVDKEWRYRRSAAPRQRPSGSTPPSPGDTSNTNVGHGNDNSLGYLFLPLGSRALEAQLAPGAWRGGLNLTAFGMSEQRAFAFYHWYTTRAVVDHPERHGHLAMNYSLTGTASGLSKLPYLRDTRRSAGGLGGFRMFYADLATPATPGARTGVRYNDTVGIGTYFYADIHKMNASVCDYPPYILGNAKVLPYHIPFRALTVDGAPNLLVAGKVSLPRVELTCTALPCLLADWLTGSTYSCRPPRRRKSIASSFWANAAMRLHPVEWASGAAAGAAAALMARRGRSTAEMLADVAELQATLRSSAIRAPLEWTFASERR
jgi:hypothetical protein